jgi:hypothetical protein
LIKQPLLNLGFVISRNLDETHSEQPKIHREIPCQPMNFKNLKKKIREPKVSRLLPNVCDFQKEKQTLGYKLSLVYMDFCSL